MTWYVICQNATEYLVLSNLLSLKTFITVSRMHSKGYNCISQLWSFLFLIWGGFQICCIRVFVCDLFPTYQGVQNESFKKKSTYLFIYLLHFIHLCSYVKAHCLKWLITGYADCVSTWLYMLLRVGWAASPTTTLLVTKCNSESVQHSKTVTVLGPMSWRHKTRSMRAEAEGLSRWAHPVRECIRKQIQLTKF